MRVPWSWLVTPLLVVLPACPVIIEECECPDDDSADDDDADAAFEFWSTAFVAGGQIPATYTCDGDDTSPPLGWSGVPAGTESFAIVMWDVDATQAVHWAIFDIPGDLDGLAAGVSPGGTLPAGAVELINDFHEVGYTGPCVPGHVFAFTLYAQSEATLGLNEYATLDQLFTQITQSNLANYAFAGGY